MFISSRFAPIHYLVCSVALTMASHPILAAEPSQSLAEKRLSIIKGTTPGIVIVDFAKKPRQASSASTNPAVGSGTESAAVQASVPGFLNALPPPSGRSLQSARRMDAADQGIVLPTARTASQPRSEPAAKN